MQIRRVWRACALTLFSSLLSAQTFRGSIAGTALDSSGAAVPEAEVRAVSDATGFSRATLTTSAGEFRIPDLPLGFYTVTVSRPGFQSTSVKAVEVAVSRVTALSVQLAVAQQTQLVEVSAAAVTLETASSTLSGVVGPRTVQDLPMNGRDFRQMLKLSPGVSPASSSVSRAGSDDGLCHRVRHAARIWPAGQATMSLSQRAASS